MHLKGLFMPDYRRPTIPGGSYFFTVVTYKRRRILCEPEVRTALRDGIRAVRAVHPFTIDAWVLLPDHLHCIWTFPPHEADFPKRWSLLKRFVTQRCRAHWYDATVRTTSRQQRHEGTLWQRRYWEHAIRDAHDLQQHLEYVHWNPVKHGYVQRVADWPYSSFHRYVRAGTYPEDWGGTGDSQEDLDFGE